MDWLSNMDWPAIIAITTAVLGSGGLGVFLNNKVPRHTQLLQLIGELQEERKEANDRFDALRKDVDRLKRLDTMKDDYIGVLRKHITEELPPPPPPFPEGWYLG